MRTLESLLTYANKIGASDLHLISGIPPIFRLNGEIQTVGGEPMTPEDIQGCLDPYLIGMHRERLEKEWETHFSLDRSDTGRFRVTVYMRDGHPELSVRATPLRIQTAEELNLPDVLHELIKRPSGLILVTGPAGAGKSTTLNYLVDCLNRERKSKIVMIEDPIEFIHTSRKSVVVQLEVGRDSLSFDRALIHVLRQDPDIIVVGEMRTSETIATALTAAETGHLVLATLHTPGAVQAVERVVNAFPAEVRPFVVTQFASVLEGVISQQLLSRVDKPGRILAYEVLLATPSVRTMIREDRTHQIRSAMETSKGVGMVVMEECIKDLYEKGVVTYDTALMKSRDMSSMQKKQLYDVESMLDANLPPPVKKKSPSSYDFLK